MTKTDKKKDYRERPRRVADKLFTNDGHLRAIENIRKPNESEPYDSKSIEKTFMHNLDENVDRFLRNIEKIQEDYKSSHNKK